MYIIYRDGCWILAHIKWAVILSNILKSSAKDLSCSCLEGRGMAVASFLELNVPGIPYIFNGQRIKSNQINKTWIGTIGLPKLWGTPPPKTPQIEGLPNKRKTDPGVFSPLNSLPTLPPSIFPRPLQLEFQSPNQAWFHDGSKDAGGIKPASGSNSYEKNIFIFSDAFFPVKTHNALSEVTRNRWVSPEMAAEFVTVWSQK